MLHKLKPGKTHSVNGKKLSNGAVIDLTPTAAKAFKDKFEPFEEQITLPKTDDAGKEAGAVVFPKANEDGTFTLSNGETVKTEKAAKKAQDKLNEAV